jgi:hypothetical protein
MVRRWISRHQWLKLLSLYFTNQQLWELPSEIHGFASAEYKMTSSSLLVYGDGAAINLSVLP